MAFVFSVLIILRWPAESQVDTEGVISLQVFRVLGYGLLASGAVDVLAHVDVVKKQGRRLSAPPTDLYAKVVTAAAASGTAVEVSTAGLHQPAAELYPNQTFLAMSSEAGVPITLASDAHYPEECGRDLGVAVAAAREAGYGERLQFRRRSAELVALEENP